MAKTSQDAPAPRQMRPRRHDLRTTPTRRGVARVE